MSLKNLETCATILIEDYVNDPDNYVGVAGQLNHMLHESFLEWLNENKIEDNDALKDNVAALKYHIENLGGSIESVSVNDIINILSYKIEFEGDLRDFDGIPNTD